MPGDGRWSGTIRFGAPVLLVWWALLVVLWPGVVSPDAASQWAQLETGALDDWHPYAFAVVLGLLRRIADTPALPIALQAVAAAALTGRAAHHLERAAGPRPAWAVAVLVALLPSTAMIGVTLWKDTPFSLAVVALLLATARVDEVGPTWLDHRRNLAALAAAALTVWLLRHNGWPIVLGGFVALGLLAPSRWRRLALTAAATVVVALAIGGPLARVLDVRDSPIDGIVWAQRVALHLNGGARLTTDERELLDPVHPVDEPWPYDCKSIQVTWSGPQAIDVGALVGREDEVRSAWLRLAREDPAAELRHIACSSAIVWRVWEPSPDPTYLTEIAESAGRPVTMAPSGPGGPVPDPPSPSAALWVIRTVDDAPGWLIRPALYLYLLVGAVAVAVVRRRSWRPIAVVLPAAALVAALVPFTLVQDVRFLYAVILGALLVGPLLLTSEGPVISASSPRRPASDPSAARAPLGRSRRRRA